MKPRTLLFIIVLLSTLTASAYDAEIDGVYYNFNTKTMKATVTSGDIKYTDNVVIPETVTYNNTPYSVTSIGGLAFANCTGLTSVTIPNSVTSIGNLAFASCTGLTSLTIPNSVKSIVQAAFYDCSGLTSVTIPNSVTSLGKYAFYGCSSLTSVTIPNSVTSIEYAVFYGCSSLTSVTIPSSVTSIGEGAFYGCSSLTAVTIPSSVTSIGEAAFYGCSGLTSVTIPNSVTSLGKNAFWECSSLTSVTIPNSVTSIEYSVFYGCSSLTSVTIPNSVTSIEYGAFWGCSSLTSVTIPNSVTCIGDHAFVYCSGLTSITVENGNTVYDSRDNCKAIINTATNTLIAGCMNTIIPNSVTSIGNAAFDGCTGLTSVTISNSVTSIEYGTFWGCSSLTSVTIPNSVTSIGKSAFSECSSLTSVIIPSSVTSLEEYAFFECSSLTSVTIPNSVTSIGDFAFEGCDDLTTVISLIKKPFECNVNIFSSYSSATLFVPAGTKSKYEAVAGWNLFHEIVEMDIEPMEDGNVVNFSNDINSDTDLDGNVIGDILYSISSGDGSYDSMEGCIVITTPTDDSVIDGKDIFDDDFQAGFTGIVFKVAEGNGTVNIEAETNGMMGLKVKIGNGGPIEMQLDGKQKVSIPYDVAEDTYVYIYGGNKEAHSKNMRYTPAGDGALKIYGIEVVNNVVDDIGKVLSIDDDAPVYNLKGQRVCTPDKGIYIKSGKKVFVK